MNSTICHKVRRYDGKRTTLWQKQMENQCSNKHDCASCSFYGLGSFKFGLLVIRICKRSVLHRKNICSAYNYI